MTKKNNKDKIFNVQNLVIMFLFLIALLYVFNQSFSIQGSNWLEYSFLKTDKIEVALGGVLDTTTIYKFKRNDDTETMCLVEYYDNDEWISGNFIKIDDNGDIETQKNSFIMVNKPQGQHELEVIIQCANPTRRITGQYRVFSTTPEGDRKGFTSYAYEDVYEALPDEFKQYYGLSDVPVKIGQLDLPIQDKDSTIFCVDYCVKGETQVIEKVITLTKDMTELECNTLCGELDGVCQQSLSGMWYCVDTNVVEKIIENTIETTNTEYEQVIMYQNSSCSINNICPGDYKCNEVESMNLVYVTCEKRMSVINNLTTEQKQWLVALLLLSVMVVVYIWKVRK